jgi:hypothetical protein
LADGAARLPNDLGNDDTFWKAVALFNSDVRAFEILNQAAHTDAASLPPERLRDMWPVILDREKSANDLNAAKNSSCT